MPILCRRLDWTILAVCVLCIPPLGCQQNAASTPTESSTIAPADEAARPRDSTSTTQKSSEPPPEATIKAMLEKDMWGPPEQGGVVHAYNYRSLKIAAPRPGNYLSDGTPANTETDVFPVKVEVEVVRTFTDGTSKQEDHNQSYVFFKDEFGDWTFRFIRNH